MSCSIILITDKNNNVFDFFLNQKEMMFYSENEKVIHYSNNLKNSFITILKIASEDYSEKEINKIKGVIDNPSFYLIDTNRFDEATKVIKYISNEEKILIDNDNGEIITKDVFLKLKTFEDFFEYKCY